MVLDVSGIQQDNNFTFIADEIIPMACRAVPLGDSTPIMRMQLQRGLRIGQQMAFLRHPAILNSSSSFGDVIGMSCIQGLLVVVVMG